MSLADPAQSARRFARTFALVAAVAAILGTLGACNDSTGSGIRVSRVEVNLPSPTILVGTTAVAAVHAFDINGNEIPEFSVTWRSTSPAIASIDKNAVISAHALGGTTIQATVNGVTGTAPLTVVPLPVASVDLSPNGGPLDRGQSLQLNVTIKNQFGEVLTDRQVTWISSAPGIAQVTSSGLVRAIAAGTATITATSEGVSATVTVDVVVTPVQGGPSITSITPGLLVPGGTITITGTNFGAVPSQNEVRVAGVLATVTAASATELTVQLGSAGYGCEPTRNVFVQVLHINAADAKQALLQSAPQRTLQPGESVLLSALSDLKCIELGATGGRYVVSVYNTGTSANADTAFRLRGAKGALPPAILAGQNPLSMRTAPAPLALGARDLRVAFAPAQQRATEDAHARLLEANLEMIRNAGVPAPEIRPNTRASIAATQPIGSLVNMKIPNVGGFLSGGAAFCTDFIPVTGRVVYNGAKAIILEDTKAVFAGQMDTLFQKIGQEFDNVMYDIDKTNFADPLRMDDILDQNGKIIMLFSPTINSFANIAGFVVTCDFYQTSTYASSNHAEVFYAIVPTDPSSDPGILSTKGGWYRTIRSTIVHEVKHVASFSNKIRDFGGALDELWVEEGTARIAEEIWARAVPYKGLPWKSNAIYANTVFCDVRPRNPPCIGEPLAMHRHFGDGGLYDYMRDNELRSPLGPKAGFPDGSFYGSAWSLLRWSADHFASDEASFFSALIRTSQSGVSNLVARVGKPWEEILGEWTLALYLDDFPGFTPSNPRLQMPSWNYRSIYAGLATDFPSTYTTIYPLVPRVAPFGDFTQTVPFVAGGSFAMFHLSGAQTGRQLLQLLSPNGGDPSPKLRMSIARID